MNAVMNRSHHSTTLGKARLLLGVSEGRRWFDFEDPVEVCQAESPQDVKDTLCRVEGWTERGYHAVGFVAYEAASAFDDALVTHPAVTGLPLVWFAIYRSRRLAMAPTPPLNGAEVEWHPMLSSEEHGRRVEQIRKAIGRGDTYQVNLTFPFVGESVTSPESLFEALLGRQAVPHAGYLETERWSVCSASPELFFQRDGEVLVTRPMKGTAARSADPEVDRKRRDALAASPKDRAENLMIVDMLRNDLGRVAAPGSVAVSDLHQIECYSTVWQMTSTVTARSDVGLVELFGALFPCASITGAPKAASMQIIRRLEDGPRGLYTGAFGWVGPRQQAEFSVAIRTALVDRTTGRATYGVGGGIVWDSRSEAEYSEALVKARALNHRPYFRLLESLLWRPGRGFWLRRLHLDRLLASAERFSFVQPRREDLEAALDRAVASLPRRRHKVRLLLGPDGETSVEVDPLRRGKRTWRVGLASEPLATDSPFVRHKTTERSVYEHHRGSLPESWDDVVLWTAEGQLTESTVANVVLEIDGVRKTPPASVGLLPGVYRRHLLERSEIIEERLDLADLARARRIWLINSVRGWIPVQWMDRVGS